MIDVSNLLTKNQTLCLISDRLSAENAILRADLSAVTAERDRMREALKPFSERMKLLEKCKNAAKYGFSTDIEIEHLRRAKEVYENTK